MGVLAQKAVQRDGSIESKINGITGRESEERMEGTGRVIPGGTGVQDTAGHAALARWILHRLLLCTTQLPLPTP